MIIKYIFSPRIGRQALSVVSALAGSDVKPPKPPKAPENLPPLPDKGELLGDSETESDDAVETTTKGENKKE
jgi:hypothetical protein